jgi:hypothetical protein
MSQYINVIDTFLNVTKVIPMDRQKSYSFSIKWVLFKDLCGMEAPRGLPPAKRN